MGSGYRVRLFSEPLLEAPDGVCRLSPFQGALVTLVFAEGSISRPRVARLLWQKDANARSRQGIRQLKNQVRRRAGAHVMQAQGDLLVPSPVIECDIREVEDFLDAGRLVKAATLVAPGFAAGEVSGVADAFHDWRDSFVAELRGRILRHAAAKWQASIRDRDWRSARDGAEAMYLLDPCDAETTARVIEARARVGRIQAAEVAYAEFRDRHLEDPGLEAVEGVIARVRSSSAELEAPAVETRLPFVGRRQALSDLSSIFADVRRGQFSFALITGEAGIGKTRLLRELERSARLEGLRCLTAQPVELERRISLNPIIDAICTLDLEPHLAAIGEPWRTVIGTMLPPGPYSESVRDLPPIEERSLSRRLLDAFSLLFRSIADEQPTVFFLDDLHWADATTISALQFYQRRWKESYFGLIATVRPGAVKPKDPAAPYLTDLGKLGVRRVELDELDHDEARQLVALLGDHVIDEAAVTKLCALSGRHPLYLTELTRDYLSGRLVLPRSEADAFSIPISLKQILSSRMEGLSDASHAVLDGLAVGSRAMRLSDLGDLLEISLDRAADAADELLARQLIDLDRDRLWIAHDLFRTAIYRGLSEAHRAVLHYRFADHIRQRGGKEAASELAIHFDRAGRPEMSAKHGWTAAGRAFERGAVAEAAHFYELVTKNESDDLRRAEATAHLATALHLNRDMSRANPALELASTRLRAVGMLEHARRMDIRRVEGLAEVGDTPVDDLVERLSAIKQESREAGDWESVALALDFELQQLLLAERLDAVRGLYAELDMILAHDANAATAVAHRCLAMGLMIDDSAKALASAMLAVSLSHNLAPEHRLKAVNRLLIVLLQQGRFHLPENEALVAEAQLLSQRSGDLLQRFSLESNLGVAHMDAGEADRAHIHFQRAGHLLGEADMTFPRINLAINRGELSLAQGELDAAADSFESAAHQDGLAIPKYTEQLVNAGLGLCALEGGRGAEACRRHELLQEPPSTWYYDPTIILTFRARFLERRQDLEEAIALLEEAQQNLQGRLVMAWIKIQLLLGKLTKKHGDARWDGIAAEGLQVARRLALTRREREFVYLLDSPSSQW